MSSPGQSGYSPHGRIGAACTVLLKVELVLNGTKYVLVQY